MDKSRLDDGTVLVAFELPAAVAATSVSLCGDFNDWSPDAHPLALLDDGSFRTEVPLTAGRRFRFRYLLDGERWENDWAADAYAPNGLGTDDSVVDLTGFAVVTEATREATTDAATDEPAAGEPAGPSAADSAPKRRWWRFWGRRQLTPAGESA